MTITPLWPDDNREIRSARTSLLYDALPSSLITTLLCSTIVVLVQWQVARAALLTSWFAATVAICGLRWFMYHRYRTAGTELSTELWVLGALAGAWLSGGAWGALGWLMLPESDPAHQMFLSMLLAGIAAVAITTLSALAPVAIGFVVLTLTPAIAYFLSSSDSLAIVIGIMGILFIIMMIISSIRLHHVITTTLTERHERRRAESQARRQALTDDLTSLPNRRSFLQQLQDALDSSTRTGHQGAVLFLDLDRFKQINDSLGHTIGNVLLKEFAQRMTKRLSPDDRAARIGGDEFVILIPEASGSNQDVLAEARARAAALVEELEAPFEIFDHEVNITASIGLALFPGDGDTAEDVLQNADVAMYRAKESGRSTVRLYAPRMKKAVVRRLQIERDLRWSLDNGGLFPVFQPQFDVDDGLVGLEMLLRWHRPNQESMAPEDFISVAEDTGLIFRLEAAVLHMACRSVQQIGPGLPLPLSMNISAMQFHRSGLIDLVQDTLNEHALSADMLRIEITESAAMENVDRSIQTILGLRRLGLTFSIDDFGTGHSSLAYLKQLPVDAIKIDKSFVQHLPENDNDSAIVNAVIAMARHLELQVIAEGVENRRAMDFLVEIGCRRFQGFFLGRPMALPELLPWLAQRTGIFHATRTAPPN